MLGYGTEDNSPVLELTYNYGITDYDKGNGYAQVYAIHFLVQAYFTFCSYYMIFTGFTYQNLRYILYEERLSYQMLTDSNRHRRCL